MADAETLVLDYLKTHEIISNAITRDLTGISDANKMKRVFYRLKQKHYIELVPEKNQALPYGKVLIINIK